MMRKVWSIAILIVLLSTLSLFASGIFMDVGVYPVPNASLGLQLGALGVYGTASGVYGEYYEMYTTSSTVTHSEEVNIRGHFVFAGAGGSLRLFGSSKSELCIFGSYEYAVDKRVDGWCSVDASPCTGFDDWINEINKRLDSTEISRIKAGLQANYNVDKSFAIFARYGVNFYSISSEIGDETWRLFRELKIATLSFMNVGFKFNF